MKKLEKLYGYMLATEEILRIGTEVEIQQMVNKKGQPVWIKTFLACDEIENLICEGIEVSEGDYATEDGSIEICGEGEDWEIVKMPNKIYSNLRIIC